MRYYLWFALIATILECSNSDIDSLSKSTSVVDLIYKQEKRLYFSNNSSVPITLKFIDIKDDRCDSSRCHVCYGGYATVKILVSSVSKNDTILLKRISCISRDLSVNDPAFVQQSVQGINLGLSNVSSKSNSVKNYSIKLLINEQ